MNLWSKREVYEAVIIAPPCYHASIHHSERVIWAEHTYIKPSLIWNIAALCSHWENGKWLSKIPFIFPFISQVKHISLGFIKWICIKYCATIPQELLERFKWTQYLLYRLNCMNQRYVLVMLAYGFHLLNMYIEMNWVFIWENYFKILWRRPFVLSVHYLWWWTAL